MNWLDIAIVVLLLSAVGFGAARGFWLTVFEYAGLVIGFFAGAWVAPRILERLPIDATGLRVAVVMLALGGGAAFGSSLLHQAGQLVRATAHVVPTTRVVDQVAGGLLTAAVTLTVIWYVALTVIRGPVDEVARHVRQSSIVASLDVIAPQPPLLLVQLQEQLAGDLLPQLFAGLEPTFPGGLQPDPVNAQSEGVRRAAQSTVKVQATGCGGLNFGSGAVVAPERIVTNAHVVSGTRSVVVIVPGAPRPARAEVLAFDPVRDVAVLAVPGLELPPLSFGVARHGMQAAIVGYPGGGPEQVVPAVIQGEIRGEGRDIFDHGAVTREVIVLSGRARPGNSGGPLVDTDGRMLGVVFAGSLSRPEQSYALALAEVVPALEAAAAASGALDVRSSACVS